MRHNAYGRLAMAGWLIAGALSSAGAQTTTNQAASLLVFPRVIVDPDWDTVIQISNTANRPARAVCYYVNGALTLPGLPPGPSNPPLWTQVDFILRLRTQQPTHWVVSRGRAVDDAGGVCAAPFEHCDGTGLDPGSVPPVEPGFSGSLFCYEVAASGAPWAGNALTGHATLTHLPSGEVAKYPAVGSVGLPANDADGTLCLGGEAHSRCPRGAEYRGCPRTWTVSHPADFDDAASGGQASRTRLTVVPCGQDFASQQARSLTLQLLVTNELEQRFSASATVDCWADLALADINPIFHRDTAGSDWLQTQVRSSAAAPFGFRLVQTTEHATAQPAGLSIVATVPPQLDDGTLADSIRLPEEDAR